MIPSQIIRAHQPEKPWYETHLPGTWVHLNGLAVGDVTVTPNVAQHILDRHNTRNRPVHEHQRRRLVATLRTGFWHFNGEPIVFDEDAVLGNGQHRLMACVECGIPFRTLMVIGVSKHCFQTYDQQAKRTVADLLGLQEEANATTLAAAVSLMRSFYQCGVFQRSSHPSVTINDHLTCFDKTRGLTRYVNVPKHTSRMFTSSGLVAALHYVFDKADQTLAGTFFNCLENGGAPTDEFGTTLQRWTGVKALNERLIANLAVRSARLPISVVSALAIKAWNAVYNGTSLKLIRWSKDEPYPRVAGWIYQDAIPVRPIAGRAE